MSEKLRIFVDHEQINGKVCILSGGDHHYIKNVLRGKRGGYIELRDGTNKVYMATIQEVTDKSIKLHILQSRTIDTELPIKVTLAQALPKSDKMEQIIQKCVELGVHDILPVQSERCIAKVSKDKEKTKLLRWQKIIKAAALQSGRGVVPEVLPVASWPELIRSFSKYDLVLIPWELEETVSLRDIQLKGGERNRRLMVVIGPEGGFTPQEIEDARNASAQTITLGKRILRTETAGMAILAMLNFIYQA